MAYDTCWSDDQTLTKAREALVKEWGFSTKEAEQAVAGLVYSGFLIREKTSEGLGQVQCEPVPPDHLLPAAPQPTQVRELRQGRIIDISFHPYGFFPIYSIESQLPFDE